jgi:hypothetical protein
MDDLPFRVVVHAGRTWTIREMEVGSHPWALGDRCLICEDGNVVRRFWVYPEDWRSIAGDALANFCQNARPSVSSEIQPRLSDAR